MLDVRRFHTFLAVVDTGSFTAAARQLHLTQSAVSQQVAQLERDLGVTLLERVARGVVLTDAGDALTARARRLLGELTVLEHEVRQFGASGQPLRIGSFTSAGAELLPAALRLYLRKRPEQKLTLHLVHPDDAASQVLANEIDVLIAWEYDFAAHPLDATLTQVRLPDDPLRAVLPAGHPLARRTHVKLAELAAEPWITRSHRPPYEDAYPMMCRLAGFEPNITFQAEDYRTILGLVAAGIGVSLVPALSIGRPSEEIAVRPLSSPTFTRRVTLAAMPETAMLAPVAELFEAIAETSRMLADARELAEAEHD
jgi:DNA-binding transcriptional LysR family regulator